MAVLAAGSLIAQTDPLLPAVAFSNASGPWLHATWPADVNGDGAVDLVGSVRLNLFGDARVQIALGAGDGTFGTPIVGPLNAIARAVGDFDADGDLDVVAQQQGEESAALFVLPGNGNGTLGAPAAVDAIASTFVLAADVNRDGRLDLIAGEEPDMVHVYPGLGDLTFAPRTTTIVGWFPYGGVAADFNGDTLPEIVVAARYGTNFNPQVNVLVNVGGVLFARTDIPMRHRPTSAAAGELNGDGLMDLVVSTRGIDVDPQIPDGGFAYVFFGTGTGIFLEPVVYEVERGAHAVVVADFTRDGKPDIATGNRSFRYLDDCTTSFKDVDSVSILPGNGDGTFAARTSFALQSQADTWTDPVYRDRVSSLSTADVNGDGHADLVVSDGKVMLTVPPRPNRLPAAQAGEDFTNNDLDGQIVLFGGGTDPDHHFLTFQWTHDGGRPILDAAHTCVNGLQLGTHVFTLTVDDGRGGTATDAMTYTRVPPPFIEVIAPAAGDQIQAGVPYAIRWNASEPPGTSSFTVRVWYSPSNSSVICSGLPAGSRTCDWVNPGPATDTATIEVSALDAGGEVLETGYSGGFRIVPSTP